MNPISRLFKAQLILSLMLIVLIGLPGPVAAQTELVTNGGFETGDLTGWVTQVNFFFAPPYCIPAGFMAVPTGFSGCDIFMQPAQPVEGNFVALSGFESAGGGQVQFYLYQDVVIPADGTVDFTFSYRAQFYSMGSWFFNRFMEARVIDPLGSLDAIPLQVLHRFDTGIGVNCGIVTPGPGQFCEGQVQNTGWVTVNGDLSAFAGQTIRLLFYQEVPSSVNGPALLEYDEISVTHTPNTPAGVTVTQSGGSTDIAEGGATDTFAVELISLPLDTVTINMVTDGQCSVAPNPIVFAAGEVGPVMVTVTAVDDALLEGPHACSITLQPVVSADLNYNGIDPADITANVTDNDTPGVFVSPTALTVRENSAARTYEVVLTIAPPPGEVVTITPAFNAAQLTVVPADLQFDNSNWNSPQVFSVTAVNNAVVDGQRVEVITHTVTSTGLTYTGAPAADVTVTIRDDDGSTGGTSGGTTRQVVAPPVPLCADLNGTTNPIVRANPPAGVYGVHCGIIAQNSTFVRTPAEVGVEAVLARGVIHAVDVFSPSGASAAGMAICLQGSGEILFLAANAAPRTAQALPSQLQGDYTCTTLPGLGTVVLVHGTPASALAPPIAASSTLNGCTVTTTNTVRLRSEPNVTSAVLTTLPYATSYQATERVPGWLRLIWSNTQGWVSEEYVTVSGGCNG